MSFCDVSLRAQHPNPAPSTAGFTPNARPRAAEPRGSNRTHAARGRRSRPGFRPAPPGFRERIFFPSVICLMQSPASRYGPAWLSAWPPKLHGENAKNGTQHASARTPGRQRHSARGVRTTPPGSRRRRRRHGRDQRRARAPGGLHQGVHPPAAQVHQARPQGCARAGRAGRARARGVEGLFARAAARAPRAARSAEWTRRAGSRPPLSSRGHAGMTTAAACTARAWVGGGRCAQRGGPCTPRRTADRRRC